MSSYTGTGMLLAEIDFSVFEFGMFTCFGVCWLASIYKSIKAKRTDGKSLLFLCIVWIGYVCGVIHKVMYSRDLVLALYIWNLVAVFVDIMLYLRYSRHSMETLKVPFTLR